MLNIFYDPYMVEEIVFSEVRKLEAGDASHIYEDYHNLADKIYEMEKEEQGDKFIELNKDFFNRLGLNEVIRGVVEELPDLKEKIEEIHVRKASTPVDIGADLVDANRKLVVRIFPEQYLDIPSLKKVLRHEFLHTIDVLNEEFGYEDAKLADVPTEENIIRERFRLFWDISVDSRLEKWGKESIQTKRERFAEFETLYSKIPSEKSQIVFEGLWADEELTYLKMVALAKDPCKLLTTYGVLDMAGIANTSKRILLPGHPCPLCKFPVYDWIDTSEIDEEVINGIKEDFPDWQMDDGICERCVECYSVRAGIWMTPKKA